jgi:hypothetical protein
MKTSSIHSLRHVQVAAAIAALASLIAAQGCSGAEDTTENAHEETASTELPNVAQHAGEGELNTQGIDEIWESVTGSFSCPDPRLMVEPCWGSVPSLVSRPPALVAADCARAAAPTVPWYDGPGLLACQNVCVQNTLLEQLKWCPFPRISY